MSIHKLLDAATSTGYGPVVDLRGISRDLHWEISGGNADLEASLDGVHWFTLAHEPGGYPDKTYVRFIRANATFVSSAITVTIAALEVKPPDVVELLPPGSAVRTGPAIDLHGLLRDYSVHRVGGGIIQAEGSHDGVNWRNLDFSSDRPVPKGFFRYIRGRQTSSGSAALLIALGHISRS